MKNRKFTAFIVIVIAVLLCAILKRYEAFTVLGAVFATFCTAITVQKNEHFSSGQTTEDK